MLLVLRRLRHSDPSNLKMTHVSRAPDYCTAIPGGQEDRNPQNVSKFTIVNTWVTLQIWSFSVLLINCNWDSISDPEQAMACRAPPRTSVHPQKERRERQLRNILSVCDCSEKKLQYAYQWYLPSSSNLWFQRLEHLRHLWPRPKPWQFEPY